MKLGTYVITRPFNGFNIPVPFQNVVLRDYCSKNGLIYSLPEVEHKFNDCYMSLFTLIDKLECGGRVLMVSLDMLPSTYKYNTIVTLCLEKNISMYGVLERRLLRYPADYLEYIKFRRFSDEVESAIS